ncbi:cytochrome P450 [Spirosoma areae]
METTVTPTRPVPLHPGLPLVGNTWAFFRHPLSTLQTLQRQQHRMVHLRIGGRHQYLVFSPEDSKHVLQENHRNYGRSPAFQVLKIFLGNGLLTSDGEFWRRQRRLAQPAFHRQKLAALAQTMISETANWLDELNSFNPNQPVNVSQAFMDVTMRIVCKTLFGSDQANQLKGLSSSLDTLNYMANERLLSPIRLPISWPTPGNRRFRQAGIQVDSFIYGVIDQRRQNSPGDASADDLLGMLLSAEDEETGEGMSDQQLRDECVTLFAAGHETTAVSMAWTIHLLTQHPDVLARLRAESRSVLGDVRLPQPDVFRALPYTMQVIQESLRLYPPAWIMSRLAHNDDHIGPYTIPAGSTALVCPYLLHRDPRSWKNPDRFDPERFAAGGEKDQLPAYAYLPFGGGPRLCIGNQFALMEMQILLALFVRTFDVKPLAHQRVRPKPLITLRPNKPINVLLAKT